MAQKQTQLKWNSTVFLRESVKNVTRKTIKERYEAKVKAAAAKKGKK